MKPDFTDDDREYATKLYNRLKRQYGKGLNSRQLSKEMGIPLQSASATMNGLGFRTIGGKKDPRYPLEAVIPAMTLKHHKRMKELKERI